MSDPERDAMAGKLAKLAHEMRTPLNAVMGFAQVLRAGAPDEARKGQANHIVTAAEQLAVLIDDMSAVARTGR